FVSLRIVLLQVLTVRARFEHLEPSVTCHGAQAVRIKTPAIDRKAMFRSARGRNNAAEAGGLQHARDLTHRLPKEFNVLESLAGNDYVDAGCGDFAPVVRILQDEIDI